LKKGFTLVELAIVLVIIGLLVTGVLAGQELIHQAKLQSVIKEFRNYQTSLATFYSKYNGLPGDIPNAVRFWGAQAGGTADGVDGACAALSVEATSEATCNGDGNGFIGSAGDPSLPEINRHEIFRAWQQLANAGLIQGTYTGVHGSASVLDAIIGVNVPASKMNNGGWVMQGMGNYIGASIVVYDGKYMNPLRLGAAVATTFPYERLVTPEDAYQIDVKMDDGKPAGGMVRPYRWDSCVIVAAAKADDTYLLSDSSNIGCSFFFITGF
jgi:prepilin-type N-terminal cleavage/methylation domain-containing protein